MMNSHDAFQWKSALYYVFFLFLMIVTIAGHTESEEEECNDKIWLAKNEAQCLSRGGICVKGDFCPEDARAEGKGLCPEQEPNGVVCCHKVPEEASCHWHGGECMEDCGEAKNFGQKNCTEGKMCCLLLAF